MIKNYTISSLKALSKLPKLDIAQITLNSRTFPSKRKTVETLEALSECHDTKIIIHYDYIYIISRFGMFNRSVQNAIIDEIISIMNYAERDKHIIGIVMHTDWPLRRDCYMPLNIDKIRKTYNKSLWDVDSIIEMSSSINDVLLNNIKLFYNMFLLRYQKKAPIKIYLENTVKVPFLGDFPTQGSVDFLVDSISGMDDLFGVCIDTEHDFAVTGEYRSLEYLKRVSSVYDIIVHLNTIPSSVKPKSLKDRHSETTIFDCSVNSPDYYLNISDDLRNLNIPFVREVKEETMLKEMDQVNKYEVQTLIHKI